MCSLKNLHRKMMGMHTKTCKKCGQEKPIDEFREYTSRYGKRYHRNICKGCTRIADRNRYSVSPERRLCSTKSRRRDFFRTKLNKTRSRANKKGLAFTITKADLISQWEKQQGLCYYTNLPLSQTVGDRLNIMSIDRVDSTKGYTPDNIVLCRFVANEMKNDQSVEEFSKEIQELYLRTVIKANVGPPQIV
jgi:hypothetical protein